MSAPANYRQRMTSRKEGLLLMIVNNFAKKSPLPCPDCSLVGIGKGPGDGSEKAGMWFIKRYSLSK